MKAPAFEVTDDVRRIANTVDMERLVEQVKAQDPACILSLTALVAVSGEGLVLALQTIGAMTPLLPDDLQVQVRAILAANPQVAELMAQGAA